LILKGADAIVFVADSQIERFDENIESFQNMEDNLKTYNISLERVPLIIQYNKRDLPNITSVDELQKALNPNNKYPYYEAVAVQGIGVFETLKEICKRVLMTLA
jgi:signal recognition particle receptor subunit beta